MLKEMNRTMHEALRLMRAGDLRAATQAIKRGLQRGSRESSQPSEASSAFEGSYHVVDDAASASVRASTAGSDVEHVARRAPAALFRSQAFTCDAGVIDYKLFVPEGLGTAAPPLIVMLHGCTQSPDDFARGTRMNALAQQHGYVVAYPAQSQSRNASRCWNWFRSGDQQRGQGEPAILAALTRHLVDAHALDERRVYVAGLSAGGAMAAVLAATYPDVYAAIGVHSGLPSGAAHDLPSAFAAMKQGAARRAVGVSSLAMDCVPAIVFHGDRDVTVDPCNGAGVIAQRVGEDPATVNTSARVEQGSAGGRSYTRTVYSNAAGNLVAEQWLVHGAGHAWFGGDAAGSYTDASGPDASEEMLRFFSAFARSAIN
jgi:poly(hydroxyalkanoate) depolymerase family esterase